MRSVAHIVSATSTEQLYSMLRSSLDPLDVVAVGTAGRDDIADVVRQIRRERPQLPVVAYLDPSANQASTIPRITEAGVHEFIIPGYNDEGVRLRAAVLSARRYCAAGYVLGRLAGALPTRLLRFAEAIMADPLRIDSVPALAAAAGVHRKTLYNWCRLTGFFSPGDLLLWSRLALVAHYLGTTRCSVELIARDLGYTSDTALRNTLKRKLGLTATELRDRGGLDAFVSILKHRLASRADHPHTEPTP